MKRTVLNLFGALGVCSALNLQLSTALAQGTSFKLLTTFAKTTPAAYDGFGGSMAAVGTDRVIIGAYYDDTGAVNVGAAYLFSTDGALLTTFTDPAPATENRFGCSMAAVGSDRVLLGAALSDPGAINAGAAYLFSTSGVLVATFANPTPQSGEEFGYSVAAVGADRVLIGAPGDDAGGSRAGAAYLFTTNGALLIAFTNPTPAGSDWFSYSVAAVGSDRVLIGAIGNDTGADTAGAAYLFSTNGALVTTFTNPTPVRGAYFGFCVAAVGSDRVLVGTLNVGKAYLFSTNGALLTTFTSPTPTGVDQFGSSVAGVGNNLVLIGARENDTDATNAGAAYLFSTNGTLLTTFTNPTPTGDDRFGSSVAAVGNNRLLIAANGDSTGATGAGAAFLFSIAMPTSAPQSLNIQLTSTNKVAISWPSPSTGWALQQNTSGLASGNWSNAIGPFQDDGTTKTFLISPPTGERFFRLFKP